MQLWKGGRAQRAFAQQPAQRPEMAKCVRSGWNPRCVATSLFSRDASAIESASSEPQREQVKWTCWLSERR